MTEANRFAAVVERVDCSLHEHYQVILPLVYLRGAGLGWSQAFGGICVDAPQAEDWKRQLARLFDVASYADIVGRGCTALFCWPGRNADVEGLEVDGRRFTITDFRRRHWPDVPTPLAARAQALHREIDRHAAILRDRREELARIREGYVDWSASPAPGDEPA